MKFRSIVFTAALCTLLAGGVAPAPADAHGGGLNKSGCHNQKSTGSYHCHNSSVDSNGKTKRSSAARNKFRKNNPCPATGSTKGRCPGYHVDHIVPLACGGADAPGNMQWLTARANLSKGSMGCRY
jgi:hypothetical protein